MIAVAQDRRVRRTQRLLAKALIALTLEKGYETVTIRDITELADVGYATFFRHYRDKDELLEEVLDVVLEEITGLLAPALPDADQSQVGTLLFRFVQDHDEVVRVMLGSRALLGRLITQVSREIAADNAGPGLRTVPLEIAAYHIVNASIGLIQWWLDNRMPYPPEQMGRIYQDLIAGPTAALAFQQSPKA